MKKQTLSIEDKAIGSVLRSFRLERHLTQDQAAKLLGTQQRVVSMLESGKRHLSVVEAVWFATALHISQHSFIVHCKVAVEQAHAQEASGQSETSLAS